jgi:hypothetical protein
MREKEIVKSQYRASLAMLRAAIERCPDSLWEDPEYSNPFWHVAYHVIFYTHFYLHPTEEDFIPWEKHRDEIVSLGDSAEGETPYSKEDLLEYLDFCLEQMEQQVDALDLEAESGFYWLSFDKLELQFYNIRHVQQHTGGCANGWRSRGDRGRLGQDEGLR